MNPVRAFYQSLGVELPEHSSANCSVHCFAAPGAHRHEDRRPSCSVNLDTGVWFCHACGERGGPYHAALARGRDPRSAMELLELHGLLFGDHAPCPRTPASGEGKRRSRSADGDRSLTGGEGEIECYRQRLHARPDVLARLGQLRGWTPEAIAGLSLGFDGERIVFPVRDAGGALVGLLRYEPDPSARGQSPKMLAASGSTRELFPSPESITDPVAWIVEGEPDAVSGTSLGLGAIAVPGCHGWRADWASRFGGLHVVIVCDCDVQGRRLAASIARDVLPHAASVRVLDLWAARDDGYDLSDVVLENVAIAAGDPACSDWRGQTRGLLISAASAVAPLAS
jgi:hypothetical protein